VEDSKRSCCCSGPVSCASRGESGGAADGPAPSWIIGRLPTPAGEAPRIGTTLGWADRWGGWMMRAAIGRMRYLVAPGLYAVGSPGEASPVLVTANYKLTFDHLRSQLAGRDAWILVLDTQGINVWCAAGKGTFGTDELVRRVEAVALAQVVSHRVLTLPQLGAVGVCAHEAAKRTGFRAVFGPVRAADLPAYLDTGVKTPDMRRVRFALRDRLAVVPVEMVQSAKYLLLIAACFCMLAGLGRDGYASQRVGSDGFASAVAFLATGFGALVLGPALLPYLPGRPFALKGLWLGLLFAGAWVALANLGAAGMRGRLDAAAWCLILPAVASFLVMNFTGATTFTSLSGVRRELQFALPAQIAAGALGSVIWLVGRFV
jgi:hypothetical protein